MKKMFFVSLMLLGAAQSDAMSINCNNCPAVPKGSDMWTLCQSLCTDAPVSAVVNNPIDVGQCVCMDLMEKPCKRWAC